MVALTQASSSRRACALAGALLVPLELIEREARQLRRDWRTDWVYEPSNDAYRRQSVQYTRLEELAESIRSVGLLQPLVVRPHPQKPGHYLVIAGHRRRRAAEMAGLREVPVVVRDAPEAEVRVLQLVENVQRQGVTPMDEARAYDEVMALRGLTIAEVARLVHVSYQHVVNRLRVLHDEVLREAVERRQISASVAREITKLSVEGAAELRRRVQDGEKLHLRAVEDVRHRLAAAGIVNPRRRSAGSSAAEAVPALPALPAPVAPPAVNPAPRLSSRRAQDAAASVADLAPWRIAPLTAAPVSRAAPTPPTRESARAAGAAPPVAPDVLPTAMRAPSSEAPRDEGREYVLSPLNRPETAPREGPRLETLVQGLDAQSYDRVTELLDYGVSHGWSCAALLHLVRCAHDGA